MIGGVRLLGKTHYAGGFLSALVVFDALRTRGLLVPECNEFLQLMIMCPFASFGSIFSDLDQGPDSIPSKAPVARGVHKVLRLLGARHRSWQTHSIVFTGGFCALLVALILFGPGLGWFPFSTVDWVLIRLSILGFVCGVISHLFLDALSTAGIILVPGVKLHLVPDTPGFKTGGLWEKIVYLLLCIGILFFLIKLFVWLPLSSSEQVVKVVESVLQKLSSFKR